MSIEAGGSAAFQATLEDNGNAITSPSPWTWATEDNTDTILQGGGDGSTAKVTIQANPARTTLTATATTTDPAGTSQSGSVTIDVVPGVAHTYSVSVSQLFGAPRR
jgi:hypothetical protein